MRTVSDSRGDAVSRRRAGRAVQRSLLLAAVAAVVVVLRIGGRHRGDPVLRLQLPGPGDQRVEHTFWAMSSRGIATGFNDTMHATSSVVFGLLVVAMKVLSAVAHRGWFRYDCVATIVVVVGFGAASALAMRGLEVNHTPWAGGFERINAYAYFAWLVVLAVTAVRHELTDQDARGHPGSHTSP